MDDAKNKFVGEGYKNLVVWQNTKKLRALVYKITKSFPKTEIRRISQMNDAARSTKQNVQEGYKSGSLPKYLNHLRISQGSLSELRGDIDDCFEDQLINEKEFEELKELCSKTDYLLKRLIDSLIKKQKDGSWKNY
jgi:four helix bundle protein